MATATIESATSNVSAGFPSRLIPGGQSLPVNFSRKKASSAAVDGGRWEWERQAEVSPSRKRRGWQAFLEAVLPQPATRRRRVLVLVAVLSDFSAIILGFIICNALWPTNGSPLKYSTLTPLLLYGMIFTLLGYSERLYDAETMQSLRQEFLVLAKAFVWSSALVITAFAVSPACESVACQLAVSAPLSLVFLFARRWQERRGREQQFRRGPHARNVLIVGAGCLGRGVASYINRDCCGDRIVRGFLDETQPLSDEVCGRVEDLPQVARRYFVDEIILTTPESETAQEVLRQARRNRIDVKIVPELFGYDPAVVTLEKVGDIPVLSLGEERIPAFGLLVKRALDVTISLALLLLGAPFLAAIAIAIKLDSPGPILYGATRIGRKGHRFHCWKFRTMVAEADQLKPNLRQCNEREGAFFKIANDPRVTRVGRVLRRYSLDEVPQLWNVLRGEMSLVGPRPHPIDDFESYELEHLQRLEVTPGLTGLWQVTARHDPSFERSVALDREYIAGWNLRMDFKILCKTVLVVLSGQGT